MYKRQPISLNAVIVVLLKSNFAISKFAKFTRKDLDLRYKLDLALKIPANAKVTRMVAAAPIRQKISGRGGVKGSK